MTGCAGGAASEHTPSWCQIHLSSWQQNAPSCDAIRWVVPEGVREVTVSWLISEGVDYEKAYSDLRAAVEALADDMDERGKPDANDSPLDEQSRRQIREDAARLRALLAPTPPTTGEWTEVGE